MTTTTHDDPAMRRAYGAVLLVGIALATCTSAFVSVQFGASVVVGAIVATANLWVLSRAVRNLLAPAGNKLPWSAVAVAKFFVLLALSYGLVKCGAVLPLGLAVGFGALPFGILLSGTFALSGGEETDHA